MRFVKLRYALAFTVQAVAWLPLWFLWRFFLHLDVRGKEHLSHLKRPVIFACNHTSELDPIIMPARSVNPFDPMMHMFYVSAPQKSYKSRKFGYVRSFLYGGPFFTLIGAYPAHEGLGDYSKALVDHVEFLKRGYNVCIFPEGRITPDGNLQPAKGGVIHLALETGMPIVPVAISGHYKLTLSDFIRRRRYVTLSYGQPITIDQLLQADSVKEPSRYRNVAEENVMRSISQLMSGQEINI